VPPKERTIWNQKHAARAHAFREPDEFLVDAYRRYLSGLPPGEALDLAGGAGRHALWLAQRGWNVKLIDVADAAIALAEKNAHELLPRYSRYDRPGSCGRVKAERIDLNSVYDLGEQEYDLVIVFYFLRRELFPAIIASLKPRGLLFYKTFTEEQLHLVAGPRNPDYLLQPGELRQGFHDLEILRYKESVTSMATAELVARKSNSQLAT
jgi:SAM-dependent methyltransferase